jgi:hypothetical protein
MKELLEQERIIDIEIAQELEKYRTERELIGDDDDSHSNGGNNTEEVFEEQQMIPL